MHIYIYIYIIIQYALSLKCSILSINNRNWQINFTHGFLEHKRQLYRPYNPNSKRCSLCLHKKLEIEDDPKEIFLNKLSEVIFQCHHQNKYKLKTLMSSKKDQGIT